MGDPVKEFRQLRRDRRTVAMLLMLPFLFLIIFGYAASFDVERDQDGRRRADGRLVAALLPEQFDVVDVRTGDDGAAARRAARRRGGRGDRDAVVALARSAGPRLVDGSELFAAQAALRRVAMAQAAAERPDVDGLPQGRSCRQRCVPALEVIGTAEVEVLFNPDLKTSVIMVPGLCGIILVFVGTVATALGVVRERQAGTLEQLAVMPFRPRDVFVGKIGPYLLIAAVDMVVIVPSASCSSACRSPARSPPSRSARRSSCSSPSASACSSRPSRRPRGRRSSWR